MAQHSGGCLPSALLLSGSVAGKSPALSSGTLAQLSSMPMLPCTKASTAHLQVDTCHCLYIPPPIEPYIFLPLLASKVPECTPRPIPSNPQQGIKKSLGLLCAHISLYTLFLVSCIVIVCLHVPRACWAVSAQMFHEGRGIYTNVYNCTRFS